jgi:hypothetical protein
VTEWYEGDVITNGERLHYHQTGGDKPPYVGATVLYNVGRFSISAVLKTQRVVAVRACPRPEPDPEGW